MPCPALLLPGLRAGPGPRLQHHGRDNAPPTSSAGGTVDTAAVQQAAARERGDAGCIQKLGAHAWPAAAVAIHKLSY